MNAKQSSSDTQEMEERCHSRSIAVSERILNKRPPSKKVFPVEGR